MRYLALLAFLAFPAIAYSPQELLSERQIPMACKDGVCTIKEDDLKWIGARDALMQRLPDAEAEGDKDGLSKAKHWRTLTAMAISWRWRSLKLKHLPMRSGIRTGMG